MRTTALHACSTVTLLAACAASAQVCQWGDFYGGVSEGGKPKVSSMVMFDFDDQGPQPPQLVISGVFGRAGQTNAWNIATWDGTQWFPLADGLGVDPEEEYVRRLAIFDEDGPGPNPPRLFAAGNFVTTGAGVPIGHIARWNGMQWEGVGGGLDRRAYTLLVWDPDGNGPERERLVVGGGFAQAGGVPAKCVATWDGQQWSALDGAFGGIGGTSQTMPFPFVRAMTTLDSDGAGPQPPVLYVGGEFTTAGGERAGSVAAWHPSSLAGAAHWQVLTGSPAAWVHSLCPFDPDGAGPAPTLVVHGGAFVESTISAVAAAWNPISQTWQLWRNGIPNGGIATALRTFDDGSGPRLYAGGNFSLPGSGTTGKGIAVWEPLPQGAGIWRPVAGGFEPIELMVYALFEFDTDGPGPAAPALLAGGKFDFSGQTPLSNLALLTCPPCYANCDSSPTRDALNLQDFLCFQARFAIGDPYANCDGSTREPTLNIADYICFMNRFAAGCP